MVNLLGFDSVFKSYYPTDSVYENHIQGKRNDWNVSTLDILTFTDFLLG